MTDRLLKYVIAPGVSPHISAAIEEVADAAEEAMQLIEGFHETNQHTQLSDRHRNIARRAFEDAIANAAISFYATRSTERTD